MQLEERVEAFAHGESQDWAEVVTRARAKVRMVRLEIMVAN